MGIVAYEKYVLSGEVGIRDSGELRVWGDWTIRRDAVAHVPS